jgi:hypothetical protein
VFVLDLEKTSEIHVRRRRHDNAILTVPDRLTEGRCMLLAGEIHRDDLAALA